MTKTAFKFNLFKLLILLIVALSPCITAHAEQPLPKLFLFIGDDSNLKKYQPILSNPYVSGAQVIYTWKELEPRKGVYDFSKIERDIRFLNSIHKKLFIQLQDRSFQPDLFNVPDYVRYEKIYHGGVALQQDFPGEGKPISQGWVARVWDPTVRDRFQVLMQQLAMQFDGEIYGINLPETSADFDLKNPPQDFTPDKYFFAELDNIKKLRELFHNSIVIQYINFFPGEWNDDKQYMSRLFSFAEKNKIGLGGPDVVPYRKSQMKNSYPFFHSYKGKLQTIGMAVQEPDYTYINPKTHAHYTFSEFYEFTKNYLGANILFWNTEEPFFSTELLPKLNKEHFAPEN